MIVKGFILPGLVQPLLSPNANQGYKKIREAFDAVRAEIEAINPDLIVIYSTMWPSILGHQVQAKENLKWTHVDEEFHELGSIKYHFQFDKQFANQFAEIGKQKGLMIKVTDYEGFPVDTGSVVALKLINPDNKFKASIVSSNIYSDRAETVVLGKAVNETLKAQNKKAVAIVVSSLSNRLHQTLIDPKDDKIHSLKDQEWNLKMIELLEMGRLEDLAQLSRQIHKEARVKKVNNFKPLWWLSAVMGAHNRFEGKVFAYEPIYGVGCAVVGLTPAAKAARDLEFDEDNTETYLGERNVLESVSMSSQSLNPGEDFESEENR